MLRSEGDGYLKHLVGKDSLAKTADLPSDTDDLDEEETIFQEFGRLKASESTARNGSLDVKLAGHKVPQKALFDIKTRSSKREFDMEEIYPRLWANQTPNFILAYHQSGNFHDIQIRDVTQELKHWELRNSKSLHALHATFEEIIRAFKLSATRKVGCHYESGILYRLDLSLEVNLYLC